MRREKATSAVRTYWGQSAPSVWYHTTESWKAARPWVTPSPSCQPQGSRMTTARKVSASMLGSRTCRAAGVAGSQAQAEEGRHQHPVLQVRKDAQLGADPADQEHLQEHDQDGDKGDTGERRRLGREHGSGYRGGACTGQGWRAASTSRALSSRSSVESPTGYWCGFKNRLIPGCKRPSCRAARERISLSGGGSRATRPPRMTGSRRSLPRALGGIRLRRVGSTGSTSTGSAPRPCPSS